MYAVTKLHNVAVKQSKAHGKYFIAWSNTTFWLRGVWEQRHGPQSPPLSVMSVCVNQCVHVKQF